MKKNIKYKVIVVAGARPNFMKVAPLMKAFKKNPSFEILLVHTGQHYDYKMSDIFFRELKIPAPNVHLGVQSGTHAQQTAQVLEKFEHVLLREKPKLVVVVGDVNSTLACALASSKLGIRVAHVEAGLRSFDRKMPEEMNRLVTDKVSNYLFVTEESGYRNLIHEGAHKKSIFFVGNVMIDSLFSQKRTIEKSDIVKRLFLKEKKYAVVTLHRPSNVDRQVFLSKWSRMFCQISKRIPIVWPVHPRTKKMLVDFKLWEKLAGLKGMRLIEPLGYVDFIRLVRDSALVLTDSGGIQEETTFMNVPCLTMRENTERPVTLSHGSNCLVGTNPKNIHRAIANVLVGRAKKAKKPKYWDGKSSDRIVKILCNQLKKCE